MPENCNPSDCPVASRVDALKEEFNRYRDGSSNTHRQMFDRLGALERHQTSFITWKDGVDKKLDTIVEWVEAEKNKPNKLLDKLKENSLWLVLAALLGIVLGRFGL